MIPPKVADNTKLALVTALALIAVLAVWRMRERRMAAQLKSTRLLHAAGEAVIASASPSETLRGLNEIVPQLWRSARLGMFVYNRGTKMLTALEETPDAPRGPMAEGLTLCCGTKTLLAIPDTRRSSIFRNGQRGDPPRSVLFAPMLSQGELMGVLRLDYGSAAHRFTEEERAAMQLLANQAGTALRLQEQALIRERLLRTEKLASAGKLISGVANELRLPLESIVASAAALKRGQALGAMPEAESIVAEALRAAEIVARLVSFSRMEQAEARPVDVTALVAGLASFRAPEWRLKGIQVRERLLNRPVMTLGSEGQLEQVFFNVFLDAEQALAEARDKELSVTSSLLGGCILVEISFQTAPSDALAADPFDGDRIADATLGRGVCRGIVQSHGGEIRLTRLSPTESRFEVELPVLEGCVSDQAREAGEGPRRQLTTLVVEPDAHVRKRLVSLLSARGDRVVPVSNAEEAAELAQRMRFDMAICAARLPGLNWIEFFERVRNSVGGFVLLTEGFDPDLARTFQDHEGFLLSKPVDEDELERICRTLEERGAHEGVKY